MKISPNLALLGKTLLKASDRQEAPLRRRFLSYSFPRYFYAAPAAVPG